MFQFAKTTLKLLFSGEVDGKSNKNCTEARDWYEKYEPTEGRDYKSVREYAEAFFADLKAVRANLDAKAEWLLVFGGGAAVSVISYAEGVGISKLSALPAIAMFLGSMYLALRARTPVDRATPMDPRGCLDREERTDFRDAWIAASLHCASEVMIATIHWKAALIRASVRLLALGVALLVAAIAIGATS